MALTPGTRLGAFELTEPIGRGGMGEVYRARDTKLDRDVAIKVLPEAFVADPERVARFLREAKTLASLNHPNIAASYGLEQAHGIHALVMELVEGDDLSQRIARGATPSMTRCRWPSRLRRHLKRRTNKASFTAIWSPPTSRRAPMGR